MASFEQLHLTPASAAALAGLGWSPDDVLAREVAPTAARGHNLIVVAPPAPAYAAPALAGLLSRLGGGALGLLICPLPQIGEWGVLCQLLARDSGLLVQTAHGTARALRRLRAGSLDLLIAPPAAVLALLNRSALKTDAIAGVFIAWPEQHADADTLSPLMQDVGREAQRIVYTSSLQRLSETAERYARKALIIGAPLAEGSIPAPVGRVRTVTVSWDRRAHAVADLVELLDPTSLIVWTADRAHHAELTRALAGGDPSLRIATGDVPAAQVIVAFDPPSRARLEQLLAAGDVVLIVPPGTETYITELTASRRPLRLPGLPEAVIDSTSSDRAVIAEAIERGAPEHPILVLAPLFERHDAATVAAALYELWKRKGGQSAAPLLDASPTAAATASASAATPATANIYVGVGKKDGATANDLVAVLAKDLRVDRTKIGRIDLRETFTLVELPAQDAERIAEALDGMTLRRKRIRARLDRGGSRAGKR